jgi:hypothetical protein
MYLVGGELIIDTIYSRTCDIYLPCPLDVTFFSLTFMYNQIIEDLEALYASVTKLEPFSLASPRTISTRRAILTTGVQFAGQILAHLRGVAEASEIPTSEAQWGTFLILFLFTAHICVVHSRTARSSCGGRWDWFWARHFSGRC